jgi:CheY-like chemotaxis protein
MGRFDVIESSCNPKESIEIFKNKIANDIPFPGLIIVDLSMPEIDGYEFIDEIDELIELNNLSISPVFIILTSSNQKKDIEQFHKTAYVKYYINKPLVLDEFKDVLTELNFLKV